MTDTKAQADDRALRLAYNTAAYAAALLADDAGLADICMTWPSLGAEESVERNWTFARDVMAPFVRANRDAPPEALYIVGRDLHANRIAWSVLPMRAAFAYALFTLTLTLTDRRIAEDAAARAELTRKPAPARRSAPDDFTYEQHDGVLDRVGEYRHVQIFPGQARGDVVTDPRLTRKAKGKTK
jgi:hypothetical protein